ncbi:uncharacterized protein LOC114176786 [Vigna unguiculata]|uniref:uncharacterized protein LOC114176786 n=1 Tax=Vigna unguiculata TaxID=3917 RepID=UPI001016208B|nr:uncharacterized protein LOC114176786 [Vigna unguiculata]
MATILPSSNPHFLSFNAPTSLKGRENLSSCRLRLTNSNRWGQIKEQDVSMVVNRTRGQAIGVLVASGKDDTVMVDPVEAKRLAAKQMERIKAKEKLKRRRQIEAINGAWAMIGLTAGLVIEGQTGKSILTQLQDYLGAIVSFFVR